MGDSSRTRLDSWKEIARYLNRSVNTVQRWERDEDLPVHRLTHRVRGSVFAHADELDAWLHSRAQLPMDAPSADEAAFTPATREPSRPRSKALTAVVSIAGLALLAVLFTPRSKDGSLDAASARSDGSRAVLLKLTDFPGAEQHPTFSPDGSDIAFSWNGGPLRNYDIYSRSVDGGAVRRLTSHPANDKAPRWSPIGRMIAFVRDAGSATKNVMLLDLTSGEERFVTALPHPQRYGSYLDWSHDGGSLLINRRTGPAGPLRVERIDIRTGESIVLTQPAEGTLGDLYFSISPGQGYLALARCESIYSCDVFVQETRTGAISRLTSDRLFVEGLCWTPDAQDIIFASSRGGFRELWSVPAFAPASFPAPRVVTAHRGNALHPATGPSGSSGAFRLAYQWIDSEVNIWRTGPDWPANPASLEIVVGGPFQKFDVNVSPAGDKIAYLSNATGFTEVYAHDLEAGAHRRVARLAAPPTTGPSWDGSGRRVAFSSAGDIWIAEIDGGPRQITRTAWLEDRPRVAPSGDFLYFVSNRSGSAEIWRLDLNERNAEHEQITRGGAYDFSLDPIGQALYFTRYRDLPTGLWRVSAAGGEEQFVQDGVRGGCWTLKGDNIYFLDFRDHAISRYLPRDILALKLQGGTPQKVGTIPKTGDPNLFTGFDYAPSAGRFYWSERDVVVEDIWIEDMR